MSMPAGSRQSRPRSWPIVKQLGRGVVAGEADAVAGLPAGDPGADRDDDARGAVAGAEGELPVGQGGVLEPLVRAGVDGQLGAGADGADLGGDEDLVGGGRGQIDLADPDAERLEDDDLTRFHGTGDTWREGGRTEGEL